MSFSVSMSTEFINISITATDKSFLKNESKFYQF